LASSCAETGGASGPARSHWSFNQFGKCLPSSQFRLPGNAGSYLRRHQKCHADRYFSLPRQLLS
jgi:hypothetical protein